MSIAVDAVIGRSDSVAVFVGSVSVYSNGVEFTTEARATGPLGGDSRRPLLADGLHGRAASDDANLHLAVELSDGRRCVGARVGGEAAPAGDEPMLLPGGGGGSDRDANGTGSSPRSLPLAPSRSIAPGQRPGSRGRRPC